jgi:peptidoglycan L-alanyl-D-glutamate endopeptidase CwlK
VLCGHRSKAEQDAAFEAGNSKLRWPASKHNRKPSLAVDVVPYPLDWGRIQDFVRLAAVVKEVAKELNIKLVWGGDWTSFKDYPHYELVNIKGGDK